MTSDRAAERWRRAEELLGAALERDASARAAYLDAACGADVELRREVESLLAAHEQSGVLDRLARDIAPLASRLREPGPSSPIVGRTIGRYRVIDRVAGGGMGIVYKAMDERLSRTIALKFLHPRLGADDSAAERFRIEARAVAALEHPNVCTVHEIGETDDGQLYLAMPLYDGETLQQRIARGPLAVDEAVAIAVQIARGLAKAHGRGIVHRDIKPSNVFVTDDGVAKILDFGIAKLADVMITGTAGPLGTVAYMSPEQARNARVDQRTDVWSLGVVLYEMLAGQRPFDGGSASAVMARIEHDEPAPLSMQRSDVPPALDRVVARSLAKSPDDRYHTTLELERDLLALGVTTGVPIGVTPTARSRNRPDARKPWRPSRRIASAAVLALVTVTAALWVVRSREPRAVAAAADPPERSIVVRPFVNMTADRGNDYLSDGLTEEIITRLAIVPELKVISHTSAMRFKGSTESARPIADELNVAHVLEGNVRQREGRLEIAAQLVDARANARRWSATYHADRRELLRVQQLIAEEVVRALEVHLGEKGRTALERQGTRDPVAYDYYRRGRYLWSTRTLEGHQKALEFYARAIERDSSFADAYAGLADVYLTGYQLGLYDTPEDEVYSRLKWAAERAIALDDRSTGAHTSFAIALWWQRNWPGAERELRRALELNPGNATARSWYSLLLGGMGRHREAVLEGRLATELDPYSVVIRYNYGWECYLARDYDCAVEQFHRTLEINDSWTVANAQLGLLYAQTGRDDMAVREASQALKRRPRAARYLADLAYVHAVAGRRADARQLLHRAKAMNPTPVAVARVHVALGEADSALAWLERSPWKWPSQTVRTDPALDPIRSDPRFVQLVRRVDREMGLQ